jgi:hypothetical protein
MHIFLSFIQPYIIAKFKLISKLCGFTLCEEKRYFLLDTFLISLPHFHKLHYQQALIIFVSTNYAT